MSYSQGVHRQPSSVAAAVHQTASGIMAQQTPYQLTYVAQYQVPISARLSTKCLRLISPRLRLLTHKYLCKELFSWDRISLLSPLLLLGSK